jgi:hypothetical protein
MGSLSPFGRLVVKHLKNQGITRKALGIAVGVTTPGAMTRMLRDRGDPKAYAPAPEHLIVWSDLLGLKGKERRQFIAMGLLARCQETTARTLWKELEAKWDSFPED